MQRVREHLGVDANQLRNLILTMKATSHTPDMVEQSDNRWVPAGIMGLILIAFALLLLLVTIDLRSDLRAQLLNRDAQILNAVAELLSEEEENDPITVALHASKLKGVLAIRLFDSSGEYDIGFPSDVVPVEALSREERKELATEFAFARFLPDYPIHGLFMNGSKEKADSEVLAPVQRIILSLPSQDSSMPDAFVEFVLDGRDLAREFSILNAHLLKQSLWIFIIASAIVIPMVAWAFGRLQNSNRLLSQRTKELLRANHELAMTSKTSAMGAVTAHLIHGLKNPLATLSMILQSDSVKDSQNNQTEWMDAAESAQRMQGMIDDVVRIVQEHNNFTQYELSLGELSLILQSKAAGKAEQAGVHFEMINRTEGILDNHQANLLLLILDNLVENAIQATPSGKLVRVEICRSFREVEFRVIDQGPGLSENAQKNLFSPSPSSKDNGGGIGLAISRQLAQKLDAKLKVTSTGPEGTVFVLSLLLNLPVASECA